MNILNRQSAIAIVHNERVNLVQLWSVLSVKDRPQCPHTDGEGGEEGGENDRLTHGGVPPEPVLGDDHLRVTFER
jgi:hypothetical protein